MKPILAETMREMKISRLLAAVSVMAFVTGVALAESPNPLETNATTLAAAPAPDTVSAFESKADIPFQRLDEYFKNPPMVYRMIQYMRPKDHAALEKARAYGIGGLQWWADEKNGWKDYLNPKAMADYANEVRMARAEGFHVWIHDESGYPSGMAGGLVVEGDPEYELRCVCRIKQAGRGQNVVTIELPAGAEKFICGMVYPVRNGEPDFSMGTAAEVTPLRVTTPGQTGDWILCAFAQVIVSEGGPGEGTAQQFVNSGKYPNMLDTNAVGKFMEITHERYARALGGLRGKVDGFYTGEPSLGSPIWTSAPRSNDLANLPWHADLPALFLKRTGYELLPNMGALFEAESDHAKLVRFHFYRLVAETLAERYFGRIGRWCETNGVQLMVQTLQEEEIDKHVINEGDIMLTESQAQVPGLDFPVPMGNFDNYDDVWMPKFISSSALLNRRETVMGLVDPIIGGQKSPYAPPISDLRWVINMTSAMGVNQFSTYIPIDNYKAEDYRAFADYAARLALLLRGAQNASEIALYYPIDTFQARYLVSSLNGWAKHGPTAELDRKWKTLVRQLLDSGYDFNWLNDQAILAAGIKDKALVVGGMPYYSLLLPQVELMPLPVLQKLDLAAKAGVKIIWHGTVPRLGATESEHEPVRKLASALTTASEPIGEIPCGWGGDFSVRFAVDAKRIMVTRFHRQNRCLYLISNRTGNPLTVPMESATSNSLAIYDPATGVIENKKLPFNFELEANQSRVVIDSNPPALEPLDDTPSKVWRKPLAIGGPAKIIPINIALKAKASASSTAPGNYSVDCVLDGNRNTGTWEQWCNADNDPASADKPVWLMLEWDKPQTVKRIVLTLMESYLVSDYELQYRIKGEWKTYGDAQVKGNTQTTREHVLKSAVTTNAVRFVGKKGPANQPTIVRLIEFEVFEK